jgi:phosphoribosylanthranilate isomerase
MFKIKICGITTPEDALLAADAGTDAIGLNFYEKSPRHISQERARTISMALALELVTRPPVHVLGVFVNMPLEQSVQHAMDAGIGEYQFHGDEPSESIGRLSNVLRAFRDDNPAPPSLPDFLDAKRAAIKTFLERLLATLEEPGIAQDAVAPQTPPDRVSPPWHPLLIRAFRWQSTSLQPVEEYLRHCKTAGGLPHAVLVDAHAPGSYGGTGQTIDWHMIHDQRDKLLGLPLILAGGLTPDNVAQAIATARPDAVDVASGVESSPGKKDPAKVRDFVAAAKEAFATLARSASEG